MADGTRSLLGSKGTSSSQYPTAMSSNTEPPQKRPTNDTAASKFTSASDIKKAVDARVSHGDHKASGSGSHHSGSGPGSHHHSTREKRHSSTSGSSDSSSYSASYSNYSETRGVHVKVAGKTYTIFAARKVKRWSPRQKQRCVFLLSMLVVMGVFSVQLWTFYESSSKLLIETAEQEATLLDFTFKTKLGDIYTAMENIQLPGALQEYMTCYNQGKCYANHPEGRKAQDLLRLVAKNMNIEILTLVSLQSKILINASFRNNRTGTTWDPRLVVSKTITAITSNPIQQAVVVTSTYPYKAFYLEDPPVYREILSILEPVGMDHVYDTQGSFLLRLVGAPLFDDPESPNKQVIAILVAADFAPGKAPICATTTTTYDHGYAGMYFVEYDDVTSPTTRTYPRRRWHEACSSLVVKGKDVKGLNTYSASFNPLEEHGLKVPQRMTDKMITYQQGAFVYAFQKLPMNTRSMVRVNNSITYGKANYNDGDTQAVLIRGISVNDQGIFWHVFRGTIGFIIALLVLQSFLSYMSIRSFIKPVEQASYHLRANKRVDITGLVSVELFARYWFSVAVGMLAALIFLLLILVEINNSMEEMILKKTKMSVNMAKVHWNTPIGQVSQMANIMRTMPVIQDFLDDPTNMTLYNMTTEILHDRAKEEKLEHFLIVNRNSTVIWSVNEGSKLVGTWFDPKRLSSRALHDNKEFRSSTTSSTDWLHDDKATYYHNKYLMTTPDTSYNPLDPEHDSDRILTAWDLMPVFAASNEEKIIPDGLFLMGQVRNGKTRIVEKTVKSVGEGYAAIFMYNIIEKRFDMINSVYYHKDLNKMEVDVKIEGIQRILEHIRDTGESAATHEAMVNGDKHMAAVSPLPPESQYSSELGLLPIKGTAPTRGYFLLARPRNEMAEIEDRQRLYVVGAVIIQLLVLAIMNFTTYQPYAQLMKALQVRGFVKPGDRPTFRKLMWYFLDTPSRWLKAYRAWSKRRASQVASDGVEVEVQASQQGEAIAAVAPPPQVAPQTKTMV